MGDPEPPHQQQPPPAPEPPAGPPGYAPTPGVPPPPYGYAAPPGYGPPGYPQPGAPATPRSRTGLIVAIVGGAVTLVLLAVCGVGGILLYRKYGDEEGLSGLIDYRSTNPSALSQEHRLGEITYPMTPPAGGPHYPKWQNCVGDVYTAPIENGNAVHSLEHGAVWITYRPDLGAADVARLATRVRGESYLMMSPYPGQSAPISLQAWGYQLTVDDADDERIGLFIRSFRETATMEPGATCASGVTTTR